MIGGTQDKSAKGRLPWRLLGWGAAALILLLPAVTGAPWSAFDYLFMGAMLGALGFGMELAARKGNAAYRIAAALALAAGVLLLVIGGAVGIIGSEAEEANMLFPGVVAVAVLGAVAAMFRAKAMAWAMAAAGLAQLAVPVTAAMLWPQAPVWSPEVVGITAVLAGMWFASAALFRKAAA
jgi:hypothetical protein